MIIYVVLLYVQLHMTSDDVVIDCEDAAQTSPDSFLKILRFDSLGVEKMVHAST